jgi:hypothetical protein
MGENAAAVAAPADAAAEGAGAAAEVSLRAE